MTTEDKQELNQAAFRRLQDTINKSYPPGRWVAIDDGEIIADAPTFMELRNHLRNIGKYSRDVLFAEAGVDYSEEIIIIGLAIS